MPDPELQKIRAFLREQARQIRMLEEQAGAALHERGDEAAYRQKLEEKTELLIGMAAALKDRVPAFSTGRYDAIGSRLCRFAESATRARELGSIFYMSALLYPADYREGEPNDLERFIAGLEEESGSDG